MDESTRDTISDKIRWHELQAARAGYNVQLIKACDTNDLSEKLNNSSLHRVTDTLIKNAKDCLILFVSRCWEQSGDNTLRQLKTAILQSGNTDGSKTESHRGIQFRIETRLANTSPETASFRAMREYEFLKRQWAEPKNLREIVTIRRKRVAHHEHKHQIDSDNLLATEKLLLATQHTIECIALLDKIWNRSTSVGNEKIATSDCKDFLDLLTNNQDKLAK